MSTLSVVQLMSPHKHVLQQTNRNIPAEDKPSKTDRSIIILRRPRQSSSSPEAENRSELRSIRLVSEKTPSQLKSVIKGMTCEQEEAKKPLKLKPIVPNYVTNADRGVYRKPRQYKDSSSQSGEAVTQSLSIVRRNARERNRVKQVNEGFATLRNRIPDYISSGYNEEKGRKQAKKLSKVETLRMAVDYIRHLEVMLGKEDVEWGGSIKTEQLSWNTSNSSTGYPSPLDTDYQDSPATPCDQTFAFPPQQCFDFGVKEEQLSPSIDESDLDGDSKGFDIFEPDSSGEVDVDGDVEMDLSCRKSYNNHCNSPLPSISETFPSAALYGQYQLINLSTK